MFFKQQIYWNEVVNWFIFLNIGTQSSFIVILNSFHWAILLNMLHGICDFATAVEGLTWNKMHLFSFVSDYKLSIIEYILELLFTSIVRCLGNWG